MTIAAGAQGYAPTVLIQPIPRPPAAVVVEAEEEGYVGHAPSVLIKPIPLKVENPLAAVYREMWTHSSYRRDSPGELMALMFLKEAGPRKGSEIIDFGCGTGRASFMLALFGGMKVMMLDFADNCLDPEVREALVTQKDMLSFRCADLVQGSPVTAPYGYCTDVMEHIPEEDVPAVLTNIMSAAHHVFFSIATVQDRLGQETIGKDLHVTVRPVSWWMERLNEAGATVHWCRVDGNGFVAYVTAWKDAADIIKGGKLNVEEEVIYEQVLTNLRAGWQHAHPYDRQDREVVLLAGGPSTGEHLDKIKELRAAGCALVTMNGAYNWALEQGLKPSMQIVVDAREFNSRFVRPVSPECLYLLASQVHPKTLEGLPRERTFLWHSGVTEEAEALIREQSGSFYPIPGGSTVALRAIPLLRMLGFWRLHIFGLDSCVWRSNATHHAYPQPENDEEHLFPIVVGGRQFFCAPWMVAQASEFRGLVRLLGDEVEMEVYGDGLIAHIIATGAELADFKEVEE